MPRNIYITSAEGHTGKSTVALGLLTTLKRSGRNVGVYRPVSRSRNAPDHVLEFLLSQLDRVVPAAECIGVTYEDVHTDPEGALTRIITRYKAMEHRHDVVIILGSDYTDVSSPTELGYNARIAANLGAPVLLVLGGRNHDETASVQSHVLGGQGRAASEMYQTAEVALTELQDEHAQLVAVITNRVDPNILQEVTASVQQAVHPSGEIPVWSIPDDPVLVAPTLAELSEMLDGHQLKGDPELLHREVLACVISGMSMENILVRLTEGAAVVVAGDRSEVLLAILMAHNADTFPQLSGIILNGGFSISPTIERLISGIGTDLPIVSTDLNTFETALRITRARGKVTANSQRKIDVALSLFDEHVDEDALISLLDMDRANVVTPLMFEYQIIERARSERKHIVLP
jgi:phosphate acetyltransferase